MLLHLPDDYGTQAVQDAIAAKLAQLPAILRKMLTWDQSREVEMANHAAIAAAVDLASTSAIRRHHRSAVLENTNGLLRQYFAQGTDLSVFLADYLDYVAAKLNNRPRGKHWAEKQPPRPSTN